MLMPKKVRWRKVQRGRMKGRAWTGSRVSFGDYGLKALECGWITDRQIEAARIAITRFIKRNGRIWIRIFPDKPITKKPQETRMGKGKGAPDQWVAVVKPGRVLYEMEGVPEETAKEAMRLAAPQARNQDEVRDARGGVVKAEELRELSAEDLVSKEEELREQMFKLRFQQAIGQLDNPFKIREARRDIARVKTILKQKGGGDVLAETK